jgi:hypothetical protein
VQYYCTGLSNDNALEFLGRYLFQISEETPAILTGFSLISLISSGKYQEVSQLIYDRFLLDPPNHLSINLLIDSATLKTPNRSLQKGFTNF